MVLIFFVFFCKAIFEDLGLIRKIKFSKLFGNQFLANISSQNFLLFISTKFLSQRDIFQQPILPNVHHPQKLILLILENWNRQQECFANRDILGPLSSANNIFQKQFVPRRYLIQQHNTMISQELTQPAYVFGIFREN